MSIVDNCVYISIYEPSLTDATKLISLIRKNDFVTNIRYYDNETNMILEYQKNRNNILFFSLDNNGESVVQKIRELKQIDSDCTVVFTAHTQKYALDAFDLGAQQYFLKPVDRVKLHNLLKSQLDAVRPLGKSCIINVKGIQTEIDFEAILYIEVVNHNCLIHTFEGTIETGSTMSIRSFLPLLPTYFLYCHRSYIVNSNHVQAIGRDFIMKNGNVALIRQTEYKKYACLFKQLKTPL